MSGEALRNNFLAAQRLSARLGVPARELKGVISPEALPARATLMLPAPRDTLTDRDRAQIQKWVRDGGHLVVAAERLRAKDPLLDALKVARSAGGVIEGSERGPPTYAWPGREQPLRVTLYPLPALNHPDAVLRLPQASRAAVVHFPLGRGRVTVVSSLAFAGNSAIGHADNAEFFWALTELGARPEALIIFKRAERLSLMQWLGEHALPALGGLGALLMLWLWRVAPRFGPLAPDPVAARRSLLDHLRACGRFAWSTGQHPHLARVAHETVLRRIVRRYPDFAMRDARTRIAWLGTALGLSAADAELLVQPPQAASQSEFVRLMGLFQRVYEHFDREPRELMRRKQGTSDGKRSVQQS